MLERNKETIIKANALLAEGKVDEFTLLCAENVKWTLLADETKVMNGREEIRAFMTPKAAEGADLPAFTVDKIIGENDSVVCLGEMTMKEKDGAAQGYTFCDIYTFKNEVIAEFLTLMTKSQAGTGKESSATA